MELEVFRPIDMRVGDEYYHAQGTRMDNNGALWCHQNNLAYVGRFLRELTLPDEGYMVFELNNQEHMVPSTQAFLRTPVEWGVEACV